MKKIMLLGDSITEVFDTEKFLPEYKLINKGISANQTSDVLARLHRDVISQDPDIIFILIGTNDIGAGVPEEKLLANITSILTQIKEKLPQSVIYLSSILPTDTEDRPIKIILSVNQKLKELCSKLKVEYVNMYPKFTGSSGKLNKEFTMDGLHLNDNGYEVWTSILKEILDYN